MFFEDVSYFFWVLDVFRGCLLFYEGVGWFRGCARVLPACFGARSPPPAASTPSEDESPSSRSVSAATSHRT